MTFVLLGFQPLLDDPSDPPSTCPNDPLRLPEADGGKMMHHMKDEGTSLWMQKEILVPGGAAEEHLM